MDVEKCCVQDNTPRQVEPDTTASTGLFQQLAVLDRFLAVWIFLAMAVGIILGNFVPDIGRSLQRGKFVGVSIPIGMLCLWTWKTMGGGVLMGKQSCRIVDHDVPDSMQGTV